MLNRGFLYIFILLFFFTVPVYAAGPLINEITTSGSTRTSTPPVWDTSSAIVYHVESGTCGPFSNAEMVTKLATDMQVWSGVSTADLSFSGVLGSLTDITGSNYTTYIYVDSTSSSTLLSDDLNPVVFDDDGSVVSAMYGVGNEYLVLGFAGVTNYSAGTISDGQAVINCKCLANHPDGACVYGGLTVEDTEADLDFTIVHEMGHFLNLGHTQVNSDIFLDGTYVEGDIPIMFPISSGMTTIATHEDDELSLTLLYPDGDITDNYCLVEGYITDANSNYVPCLDVWAVAGTDTTKTVSYTTASNNYVNTSTSSDFDIDDTCDKYCGYFGIYIKPSTEYTLKAYDVYESFVGGSGVGPCVDEQPEYEQTGGTLTTITSSQCSVPSLAAIDAGTITLSITIDSETEAGSGSTGTTSSGGTSNPVGYWCSLASPMSKVQGPKSMDRLMGFGLWMATMFLFLFYVRTRQGKNATNYKPRTTNCINACLSSLFSLFTRT